MDFTISRCANRNAKFLMNAVRTVIRQNGAVKKTPPVFHRPAVETAATSVLNVPAPIAVSTIFAMEISLLCKGVALKSTGLNSQNLHEIPTPRVGL